LTAWAVFPKSYHSAKHCNFAQTFGFLGEILEMGWLAILIMLILLDYCVFELKMGVKTYQKASENCEKVPVLNENQQKATLFEHILYRTVKVGNRGSSCVKRTAYSVQRIAGSVQRTVCRGPGVRGCSAVVSR
jgi:hypothetical protein